MRVLCFSIVPYSCILFEGNIGNGRSVLCDKLFPRTLHVPTPAQKQQTTGLRAYFDVALVEITGEIHRQILFVIFASLTAGCRNACNTRRVHYQCIKVINSSHRPPREFPSRPSLTNEGVDVVLYGSSAVLPLVNYLTFCKVCACVRVLGIFASLHTDLAAHVANLVILPLFLRTCVPFDSYMADIFNE